MGKEALRTFRGLAKSVESVRYRLPIPYEATVVEIEDADSGITGFYNVTVEVSEKKRIALKDVRGSYLAEVKPGDVIRVSREEVIFGEPKIEKPKE